MKIGALLAALTFAVVAGAPALAGDPLSYDDPGMHFSAPAGWTRLEPNGAEASDKLPVVAFLYHGGRADARSITITIVKSDESLDSFERGHESELRSTDGTFVQKRQAMKLSNGMPVYFIASSSTNQNGQFVSRYEYIVIDGQRGITVSYAGNSTDVDEKGALAALSTLYVVAYPGRAPSS